MAIFINKEQYNLLVKCVSFAESESRINADEHDTLQAQLRELLDIDDRFDATVVKFPKAWREP